MKKHLLAGAVVAALALIQAGPLAADAAAAEKATENAAEVARADWYHTLVDAAFVAQHAVLPKPEGVLIIDARPSTRKYDPGHIPTAINIPDTQFDKHIDRLPQDKNTLLIFYCDGVECMLSHKSAFKAEKLGYTQVRVYPAGYPDWLASGHIGAISVPYLKKLMDEGAPMTLIDSRPKERKYDKGHIPGAISLPDSQFDKLVDRLPADKASPLYFYCEGLSCKLSSDSAARAVKLGYTNVKVVPEGYPEWVRLYGAGPGAEAAAASTAPSIGAGKESGSIAVASLETILKEAPGSVHLIDVRDPNEFATGSFPGAINEPVSKLEDRIDALPTDKPIVFFCGAGGRSGEAHDMAKLYKPALVTYFVNADIKWKPDGSYTITEK